MWNIRLNKLRPVAAKQFGFQFFWRNRWYYNVIGFRFFSHIFDLLEQNLRYTSYIGVAALLFLGRIKTAR